MVFAMLGREDDIALAYSIELEKKAGRRRTRERRLQLYLALSSKFIPHFADSYKMLNFSHMPASGWMDVGVAN
jgi:uncharacterized protein Veg